MSSGSSAAEPMDWDDRELLAGLQAAARSGEGDRFEPEGVAPGRRLPLAQTLLDREWVRVAHPLRGDGGPSDVRGVELTETGRAAREGLRDASDSPAAVGVDPDALWKALAEHAEPGSPLGDAMDRERSGLADRGMLRSGVAAKLAHRIAEEHGLGWDDGAGEFVAKYLLPPQLDREQKALVDVAAELFVEADQWPQVRNVIRRAIRDMGLSGVEEALWSLPKSVGHSDGQTIVLSAEGLAATSSGAAVLEALVALARAAADAYLSEAEQPKVSTGDVARALEVDAGTLAQLNALLPTESFFLGSGHGDAETWVYEVNSNAADLQACETIEDYLRVRRRVTRPALLGPPPPAMTEQPGREREARHTLALHVMHDAVRESAGALYTDGHYSPAILRALTALESRVREQSGLDASGRDLMVKAFGGDPPPIDLRHADGQSGRDEQEGFRFMFMGAMQGIRNPKGHDLVELNDPDRALEYLALVSLLFHRLDDAADPRRDLREL